MTLKEGLGSNVEILFKEFHKWFHYDSKTGLLWWRKKRANNIDMSKPAGLIHINGYKYVNLNRKRYLQHRVIWFMTQGCWPKYEIDHINGDKLDNRLENLRDVHPSINQRNKNSHRDGRLVGTYFHKLTKKWAASIRANGKHYEIGGFNTELEAHKAYLTERLKYNETLYEVRPNLNGVFL